MVSLDCCLLACCQYVYCTNYCDVIVSLSTLKSLIKDTLPRDQVTQCTSTVAKIGQLVVSSYDSMGLSLDLLEVGFLLLW